MSRPPTGPDVLWLYRSGGPEPYRWMRRTAGGQIIARAGGGYQHKAACWRAARRSNPDWELCRVDDRTFTSWGARTGTNLSRAAAAVRTIARRTIDLREARRRL